MLTQRLFSSYLIHLFSFSISATPSCSSHLIINPFCPYPHKQRSDNHHTAMICPRRIEIEIQERHQRPCHTASPALLARKIMHQAERVSMLKKTLAWNKIESQRQQHYRYGSPIFQHVFHYLLLIILPSPSWYEPTIIIIKSINAHIPQPPAVSNCATPTPVLPT